MFQKFARFLQVVLGTAFILLGSAASGMCAQDEKPLDYLIECLEVIFHGGTIVEVHSRLRWPAILEKEPSGQTPFHGHIARMVLRWNDNQWMNFLAENGFKEDASAISTKRMLGDIPLLKRLFKESPSVPFELDTVFPKLGRVTIQASYSMEKDGSHSLHLWITQFTSYFVRPPRDSPKAEPSASK